MMSMDSGVETSNDSNDDSSVLQSKIPATNEPSNVTTIVATTFNNQKKWQQNELSHISQITLQPLYSTTKRFFPSIPMRDPIMGTVVPVIASPGKILKFRFPTLSNRNISATLSVPKVSGSITFKHSKKCQLFGKNIYKGVQELCRFSGMWTAINNNDVARVDYHLKKGTSLNIINPFGRTPLHIAAMRGYPEMVKLLLEHRANPNAQDFNGATPLLLAIEACRFIVIPLLLQASTVIISGDEAIELAQRKLEILQQYDGKETQEIKDIHNIVSMLFAYFGKQKDAEVKMEALMNTFDSCFSL